MKKIVAILLSAITLIPTFSGCSSSNEKGSVAVWTVDASEKITQDKTEKYSSFFNTCKLEVFGAQNEKESGQLVITALGDGVKSYTIALSDLISAEGNIFSKENIQLFNQKYYEVGGANEYYLEDGMYPDAILPFDTAVAYGENKVEKNQNQSVTVRFDIPENQPAGEYTGSLTVCVDGENYQVPVRLKVYGATVSEEVHSKTAFTYSWQLEEGEFDYSLEKRMDYYNFLAEYLVSGAEIFNFKEPSYYTDEVISVFCDKVAELWTNPKISSIRFPKFTLSNVSYTLGDREYSGVQVVNAELCDRILNALIDKCVLDGKNYMTKMYFRGMDEPRMWGNAGDEIIRCFHDSYLKVVERGNAYADSLKNGDNDSLIEEVKGAISAMPVVTTYDVIDEENPVQGITYCPYYSDMDSEAKLQSYLKHSYNELWWYGCNFPVSPYPTYHIDDSLLSARIASWMQYDYGIIGNLYWAVDEWHSNKGDYNFYDNITAPLDAGDGILVYPGKPYGLNTPVASLRLEAIRDGLEEYELLRSLDLAYKAKDENCSIDGMLSLLAETLYRGGRVVRDISQFNNARKALYELCELEKETGFTIADYYETDGEYKVKLYAKKGCEIKSNGKLLTATQDIGSEYKEYNLSFRLAAGVTGFDFDISYEGKSYTFDWYLGSASHKYTANDLQSLVKSVKNCGDVITSVIKASDIGIESDDDLLQIGVSEITTKDWQKLALSGGVVGKINKNTKSMVLNVYYNPQEDNSTQYMKVSFKYENSVVAAQKAIIQLKKGWNRIEITNIYADNWAKNGSLKSIEINYAETADPRAAVTDVYIKDLIIFDK